jgi:glycosyltransferase involved in cell wall biosynthesis
MILAGVPAIVELPDRAEMRNVDHGNGERTIAVHGNMSDRRPKLLFLAYYFPPMNVSACVRTWNVAKYLVRSGWDVTVVTPNPSVWRNADNPEKVAEDLDVEGIRRLLTGHQWRCLSPGHLKCWDTGMGWFIGGVCRKVSTYFGVEREIGWRDEAEKVCATLSSQDVDLILASGAPFVNFELAKRLARKLGCAYVLDYRDPWLVHPKCRRAARETLLRVESALVEESSAVTVVSESLLSRQLKMGPTLHVITNGFDPEELSDVEPYEFGHFAIIYAGNFYFPKRVITPVMQALKRLKEKETPRKVQWKFHYYGVHGDHVREEAQKFCVSERVVIHGRVSRTQALSAVRGSSVAVVITSVLEEKAEQDGGIVTGKLFESLGMKVPTMVIGPLGSDVERILETTGLARHVTAGNIDGMVSFLEELMSGKVPPAKNPEMYAWPNIIGKLDAVLRNVVGKKLMTEIARNYSPEADCHVPCLTHEKK